MESQLVELTPVVDFYADGLDHLEVMGDNLRMVFFRWRRNEVGIWERVATKHACVRPVRSMNTPLMQWPPALLVGPPETRTMLHN